MKSKVKSRRALKLGGKVPAQIGKVKRECFSWKIAALKLAKCVVATIHTDGKIGMGTGLVMSRDVTGKMHFERWDSEFIEALAYIGLKVVDKSPQNKRRPPSGLLAAPSEPTNASSKQSRWRRR